jgi:hypothetical protein
MVLAPGGRFERNVEFKNEHDPKKHFYGSASFVRNPFGRRAFSNQKLIVGHVSRNTVRVDQMSVGQMVFDEKARRQIFQL